jgi:hypothetical protein
VRLAGGSQSYSKVPYTDTYIGHSIYKATQRRNSRRFTRCCGEESQKRTRIVGQSEMHARLRCSRQWKGDFNRFSTPSSACGLRSHRDVGTCSDACKADFDTVGRLGIARHRSDIPLSVFLRTLRAGTNDKQMLSSKSPPSVALPPLPLLLNNSYNL